MTRRRGLLLLALQAALLLSLAGRLLLDRALRPRGWARTAPIDPELPIRGRYLSVVLQVPVLRSCYCSLVLILPAAASASWWLVRALYCLPPRAASVRCWASSRC